MAKSFNLTANLVLQGPQNIQPVVASIRRQIGSINANVNLKFDPKSIRSAASLTTNVRALSASINQLTASATSAQSAITALNASFNTFARTNSNVGKGITTTLKSVNKTTQTVNQASASIEKFGKDAAIAIKRFAAYSVATAGIFAFVGAVGKATAEAIDFQHEIVRIGQVTGKSIDQLGGLEKEITRLSTSLGISSKNLVNVAQILAQAGLSADDTKISLEALAKSTLAPTFKDIENTTEGAIAAMAQFKIRAVDLESVLGSLNSVSAAYAVESEDLVSVIRRAGGVFATASAGLGNFSTESARGVRQLQELSALFTAVRSTTRESAESIATGLRTIFARVERKSTIDYLKQFNIQLEEAGKFVGTFEGFKRISEGLKGLDTRDIRFSAIIEELGGFRQISKVIPLIKNFATAEDALNVAIEGQESLTKDAVTAQQSLAVQITKTRESFLALVRDIGKSNTFQGIAQGALIFANSMIKLGEILKPVIPLITALAAIKGFKALQQFGSGFFGTLRGIGAVGAGQNIANKAAGPAGGGTNNVVNNAGISAITTLGTNIQANTLALKQLVVAVQTLNNLKFNIPFPTGASSPVKFARGGIVPGQGNRDTVPAMLMPGEFVVRKNAVQAIGAENLYKANGMAKGGFQKNRPRFQNQLLEGEDVKNFGAIFMEPVGSIKNERSLIIPGKELGKGRADAKVNLISSSLSNAKYEKSIKSIDEPIKQIIASVARDIGVGSEVLRLGTIPNLNAIQGSIFEGAVASLGAPIGDIKDDQRTFDYPAGLQGASQYFDGRLTNIPTDAKRTYNVDATKSIRKKIVATLKNSTLPLAQAASAKALSKASTSVGGFPTNASSGSVFTAQQLGFSGFNAAKAALPSGFEIIRQGGKSSFRKLANGGSAGTDTVPAMLTPGEFVINKKAAGRLGPSTLNKLNNADKVQRFAQGGGVARHGKVNYGIRSEAFTSFTGTEQNTIIDQATIRLQKMGLAAVQIQQVLSNLDTVFYDLDRAGNTVVKVLPTLKNAIDKTADQILNQGQAALGPAPTNPLGIPARRSLRQRIKSGFQSGLNKLALVSDAEQAGANPIDIENLKANRLQNRIFGASAVAATASQLIPQNSNITAGISGATSGAATGIGTASALGVTGPIGLSVAALGGAFLSAKDAVVNFQKDVANKALETALTTLTSKLENLSTPVGELQVALQDVIDKTKTRGEVNKLEKSLSLTSIGLGLGEAQLKLLTGGIGLSGAASFAGVSKESQQFNRDIIIDNPSAAGAGIFSGKRGDVVDAFIDKQKEEDVDFQQKAVIKGVARRKIASGQSLTIDEQKQLARGDSGFNKEIKQFQQENNVGREDAIRQLGGGSTFGQVIELRIKAELDAIKASELFAQKLDDSIQYFNKLAASISLATEDFNANSSVRKNNIAGLSGGFRAAASIDTGFISRRLANPDALSPQGLANAANFAAGGDSRLQDAASNLTSARKATDILDETIKNLIISDTDGTQDIGGQLRQSLSTQGVDVNSAVISDILDNIKNDLSANRQEGGNTTTGGSEVGAVRKFLEGDLQSKFGKVAEASQKALQANAARQAAITGEFLQAQDTYIDAIRSSTDAYINVQKINNDVLVKTAEIDSKRLSLRQLNTSPNNELKALTGTSSVSLISNEFTQLQRNLASGLVPTTSASTERLRRLQTALQSAATSTTKFDNAIKVAGEAEKRRDSLQSFGLEIATAGPADVSALSRNLALGAQVNSGNLGVINANNVQSFQGSIGRTKQFIADTQGNQAASDFENNALKAVLQAQGVVGGAAQAFLSIIATENQAKLDAEAAAKEALKNQQAAADTLLRAAQLIEQNALKERDRLGNQAASANGFGSVDGLLEGLNRFSASLGDFAKVNIPERITVEVAPIQSVVTFAGENALAAAVATQITAQIQQIVNDTLQNQFGALKDPLA
jgi:TP901 family phage tail tape measure protein